MSESSRKLKDNFKIFDNLEILQIIFMKYHQNQQNKTIIKEETKTIIL